MPQGLIVALRRCPPDGPAARSWSFSNQPILVTVKPSDQRTTSRRAPGGTPGGRRPTKGPSTGTRPRRTSWGAGPGRSCCDARCRVGQNEPRACPGDGEQSGGLWLRTWVHTLRSPLRGAPPPHRDLIPAVAKGKGETTPVIQVDGVAPCCIRPAA